MSLPRWVASLPPAESLHGVLDVSARRQLARDISRLASATARSVLSAPPEPAVPAARRIGFTGPPGVGKSTLVGKLVERRAARGTSVAVLAVDPASPYSRGAILGDRIRMDVASNDPRVFMRSVSSRDAQDGLCNNVADILCAMEAHGFDEIVLETVGVGQAEHAVKALVDTVVLLMQPETGDAIQALKAGILEVADIIVISKSDLAGAPKMRETLASTVRFGAHRAVGWTVPVLSVSVDTGQGLVALEDALSAHAAWVAACRDPVQAMRRRASYRVQDLFARRLEDQLATLNPAEWELPVRELYAQVLSGLALD